MWRSACFFYGIHGGVFSTLASVLFILLSQDVSLSFTFSAGVISQSFFSEITYFVCTVVDRSTCRGLRVRIFGGLRTRHLQLLAFCVAVLEFVSFPVALLTSVCVFRLRHGAFYIGKPRPAIYRYPSSKCFGFVSSCRFFGCILLLTKR